MKGKVFIGAWVEDDARRKFKAYCAVNNVTQQGIIEQLILRWLAKPSIQKEITNLIKEKDGK